MVVSAVRSRIVCGFWSHPKRKRPRSRSPSSRCCDSSYLRRVPRSQITVRTGRVTKRVDARSSHYSCPGDGGTVHRQTVATPPGHTDAPIACTATAQSATRALEEWADLLAAQRDSMVRTAIPGGVRVQFGPAVDVVELVRLTVAEQDCCRFFSFAITVDQRGVGLEVVAPDDALPIIHALFGAAT